MKRKVYLVNDYNIEEDSHIISRAFTNFEDALRYFKSRVAEVLIFYRIHDLYFDEEPINGESMFESKSTFAIFNEIGNEMHDLPNNKEAFEKNFCFGIKFMCDTDVFTLKEIEEES